MSDVFSRTQLNFGGAFAADTGLLSGGTLTGVLMQNLQLNYSQNVTRIYEIGAAGQTPFVYYVGGRSQGSLGVGHVMGPALAMKAFYTSFSDVCSAGTNNISVNLSRSACGQSSARQTGTRTVRYNAKFCVLVQLGVATRADDLVVNESSNVTFANLEYDEA
jgi:hypothetical protein